MGQADRDQRSGDWDVDRELRSLIIHLLSFKHKMKNVVWTRGTSGLDGKFASGSEVFIIFGCFVLWEKIYISRSDLRFRKSANYIKKSLSITNGEFYGV